MDIATILGLLTGLIMVGSAMWFGGDALPFIHGPSMLITFGGTLAAVLIHFPASRVRNAFAVARNCFVSSLPEPTEVLVQFRHFGLIVRRGGLLALEPIAEQQSDPFLKIGLVLTASGCNPETVAAALQRDLVELLEVPGGVLRAELPQRQSCDLVAVDHRVPASLIWTFVAERMNTLGRRLNAAS